MPQSRCHPAAVHFSSWSPIWILLLLILISCPAAAQVEDAAKTREKLERQKELDRQTVLLVEEVATGAASLKLPENRSYVLAAAADLLWSHDEKRARTLFWESLNTLNIVGDGKSKNTAMSDRENSYFATFGLRQSLLKLVARRDPELALELLRMTRLIPPEDTKVRFPDDRELEQQIAAEAAARDPQRALQLARESLARGFTFELLNLLYRLNDVDQEVGSTFAANIIDKLKSESANSDVYGNHIAVRMLVSSRSREAGSAHNLLGPSGLRQLKLAEGQRRAVAELIANAALSVSANGSFLYALAEVRPELVEFVPERMRLLDSKIADFKSKLPKAEIAWAKDEALLLNATPEEILRASNKADSDRRLMFQQQAIAKALLKGQADSLREMINNEIDDDSRRQNLLDSLATQEIDTLAYRGDTAGLQKLLPQVRRKEERARAMAQLAIKLEQKGDHDEAVKLLGEAETLVKTDFRSETKTNALLGLLLAYALVDPNKAFAIIERTIDRANDEISKAALVDKIVKSGAFKKGEILLQHSGHSMVDFALFKYGKGVRALATYDFGRTKAVADRFQRNELRLMARLLIAQALLQQGAKQEPSAQPNF
jgi:hypothetical protein